MINSVHRIYSFCMIYSAHQIYVFCMIYSVHWMYLVSKTTNIGIHSLLTLLWAGTNYRRTHHAQRKLSASKKHSRPATNLTALSPMRLYQWWSCIVFIRIQIQICFLYDWFSTLDICFLYDWFSTPDICVLYDSFSRPDICICFL